MSGDFGSLPVRPRSAKCDSGRSEKVLTNQAPHSLMEIDILRRIQIWGRRLTTTVPLIKRGPGEGRDPNIHKLPKSHRS
jgi:hypothetical protein